jgi:hypothetical protein
MIGYHSHCPVMAVNSKVQLNSVGSNEIPITSPIEQYTPIASKSDLYMLSLLTPAILSHLS